MKNKLLITFLALLLASGMLLYSSRLATAKGNFVKITISGGQFTSEIDVTDPSLLGFFSFSDFPNARTQPPNNVGESFVITRYDGQNKDGTFHAWDMLHYYPNNSGSGGYVFYDGLINGLSEYDKQWYIASPEGDAAFRKILANQNSVHLTSIQSQGLLIVFALVLTIATGILFVVIRKRAIDHKQ
ncbi:MAG: hypothetical protein JNK81_04765 [Anaerolineales bacterium]|nr:hypothetical protein [Anaerolineales bacterium]